jgi:hypothetical protein
LPAHPVSPKNATPALSSRPEPTWIFYQAASDSTACAPFRKEKRIYSINTTACHRKSGERSRGTYSLHGSHADSKARPLSGTYGESKFTQ